MSSPDLFVVCKSCGSEVSPYITECPYCGNRLRKRAPKIERDEEGVGQPKERRKGPKLGGSARAPKPPKAPKAGKAPKLPKAGRRARADRAPRARATTYLSGDELRRPWATIVLVVLGAVGALVLAFVDRGDIAVVGQPPGSEAWRLLTTPFVYGNGWYQFAALITLGIFGALLERRHGPVLVVVLWLVAATGGAAVVVALDSFPVVLGGNAAALAFLAAWAVPVVLARRRTGDGDDEADLLGVLVLAVLVAAMPLATPFASGVAGTFGGLIGVLVGLVLSRTRPR